MCIIIYYYIIIPEISSFTSSTTKVAKVYQFDPKTKKEQKIDLLLLDYIQNTYNIYHHLTIDIFYIYNNTIRTQTYIKRKECNEWILQRMNQIEDMNKCQIL